MLISYKENKFHTILHISVVKYVSCFRFKDYSGEVSEMKAIYSDPMGIFQIDNSWLFTVAKPPDSG